MENAFNSTLQQAQKDIAKQAELKKRQEARDRAEKEKKEKRSKKNDRRRTVSIDDKNTNEKGIMDDLFKELKTGGGGRTRRKRMQPSAQAEASKC